MGKMILFFPLSRLWLGKEVVAIKKEFGLLFRRWIEEEAVVAALSIRSGGEGQSLAIKTDNNSLSSLLGLLPFLLPPPPLDEDGKSGEERGRMGFDNDREGNKGCCFLFIETKTFDFY